MISVDLQNCRTDTHNELSLGQINMINSSQLFNYTTVIYLLSAIFYIGLLVFGQKKGYRHLITIVSEVGISAPEL